MACAISFDDFFGENGHGLQHLDRGDSKGLPLRVGARAACGEDAHLFQVKVGIDAVLPALCNAPHSTHLCAGAAHTVVSSGVIIEAK